MGIEISGYKTLYVDIDETLAMSNLSDYSIEDRVEVNYTNGPIEFVPNHKNINLLVLFYKLGYTIVAWSKTGSDWASLVCKELKLDRYVSVYLSKPSYYLDDQDASQWMGPKRWRDTKEKKND